MTNSISCIIVDDEQDAIELLIFRLNQLHKNVQVVGTYSHWGDALQALREQKYDLVFMDISMPGKNGMEILKLYPQLSSEVIFVTAHEEYALDAFAFATSGYVLKPIDDVQLSKALDIATARILNKQLAKQAGSAPAVLSDRLGIPNNHGIDYVAISDIIFLESVNKCTRIVTTKTEYLSSLYLGKFQELIEGHPFFQVHRSYVINMKAILRYETSGVVIMTNKQEIPVSRSTRNEFLQLLNCNF